MSGTIEVETVDQADLRTMAGNIAIARCAPAIAVRVL